MFIGRKYFELEHVVLRPFKVFDAADVYEYASDEDTLRYLTWYGLKSLDDAADFVKKYYMTVPGIYAIEDISSKKCIGCFELKRIPRDEKVVFGYVLNRKFWGRGYMTEVLCSMINYVFEELKINRVEAIHYSPNLASGRGMEKAGMRKEGLGVEEVKLKGSFCDVVHYGLTKRQWQENR